MAMVRWSMPSSATSFSASDREWSRRVARRHEHAVHVLRADGVGGDDGHQRRVDAAGQRDGHVGEPVLVHVVAGAGHEGRVHLVHGREPLGDRGTADVVRVVHPRGRRDVDHGQRRLGRPPPGVEQALAEDRLHLDVADERLLGELARPGQQLAVGVEDHRRAVEDQLVLAADLVDVDQGARGVGRPGGQHALTLGQPVGVVRRRVDVDHQLGAPRRLRGDGAGGAEGVLADRHADAHPGHLDQRRRAGAGGEVALLVEHRVVGQVAACGRSPAPGRRRTRRPRCTGPARRRRSPRPRRTTRSPAPPGRAPAGCRPRSRASAAGPRAGSRSAPARGRRRGRSPALRRRPARPRPGRRCRRGRRRWC